VFLAFQDVDFVLKANLLNVLIVVIISILIVKIHAQLVHKIVKHALHQDVLNVTQDSELIQPLHAVEIV
jgi:hypothetical protein